MAEQRDFEQLNKDVSAWAKYQSQRMQRLVATLTLKDKHAIRKEAWHKKKNTEYKPLEKSIGANLKRDFGEVSRINFRLAKQGIWMEHGVGKNRPVRSSAAQPKPWLQPILNPALDTLADLVASNYADRTAGEIKFLIPGIVNRRIKVNNG